ncbi:uncharacterized protein N7515_004030 [Penicillium bovifimosum]|uniref:Uncharacterized protein n=1 Tax=Penicillium bovifimosum TaxID=126998 RepID=A0A9W9L6T0_9EURO|nr:uncharacterized protein N7515_004030 [Penicillium bovifimosum]KAJ5139182.1 hypothetical protein N7515_004030 [Penicillium bovifimosum]
MAPEGGQPQKPKTPADPPRTIDEIAECALRVLRYIENSGTEDPYVTGFIRSIRKHAMNAQRGDGQGMTKVTEKIETTISAPAADSTAAWRSFRARDQATTAASVNRNNTPSPPGIPEIETCEDREIIVKVGGNWDLLRKLTPKNLVENLVERAERQRTPNGHQPLAEHASFVAA